MTENHTTHRWQASNSLSKVQFVWWVIMWLCVLRPTVFKLHYSDAFSDPTKQFLLVIILCDILTSLLCLNLFSNVFLMLLQSKPTQICILSFCVSFHTAICSSWSGLIQVSHYNKPAAICSIVLQSSALKSQLVGLYMWKRICLKSTDVSHIHSSISVNFKCYMDSDEIGQLPVYPHMSPGAPPDIVNLWPIFLDPP